MISWLASDVDVEAALGEYFDVVGQAAWDGGRYMYQYGEDAFDFGHFVRYDIETDTMVELPGIGGSRWFRNATVASGTTSAAAAAPSGLASGDLEFLFCESSDSTTAAGTPNTPSGWHKLFEETQGDGATGVTTLTIFVRLNTGTIGSVTVDGVLDHIQVVRGVWVNHNVTDVTTDIIVGTGNGANTGNATVTGLTTTEDNTLVLAVVSSTRDATTATNFSAWTNANLVGFTERREQGTATGSGGGVGIADGLKAAAGGTGNSTATIAVSSQWRAVHLAFAVEEAPYLNRTFHSSCVISGKVYLFAGAVGLTDVSRTDIYDIASQTWTTGADMLNYAGTAALTSGTEDRTNAAAAAVGGKAYVVGGFGSGSNSPAGWLSDRCDEYDPATDTWTRKDDMNHHSDFPSVVVYDGKILNFGGNSPTQAESNAVQRYDPAANTWTDMTPIPDPSDGQNVECFQGFALYDETTGKVIQTVVQNTATTPSLDGMTHRYDPDTDTWDAHDSTDDLANLSDGADDFFDIVFGESSAYGSYGSRRVYYSFHFGPGVGLGILYYEAAAAAALGHWGIPLA